MKCGIKRCLLVAVVFILAAGCGTTPSSLTRAAWKGDTATVQALLAKGADVNAKTDKGATALVWAATTGHNDTVQALLAHGADVNAKNNTGMTALMMAKKRGHKEIVRMLKEAGAKE